MAKSGEQLRSELVALVPRLRRFALALSGNRDDADDLVQSSIMRALTLELATRDAQRLDSWMYRIVKNLWIDEGRRRTTRGAVESVETLTNAAGTDGCAYTEIRSDLKLVQHVFETMSPELRAAIMLVVVNEVSYREAAEILNVPIGTVMSRVARARLSLARGLASTPVNGGNT